MKPATDRSERAEEDIQLVAADPVQERLETTLGFRRPESTLPDKTVTLSNPVFGTLDATKVKAEATAE